MPSIFMDLMEQIGNVPMIFRQKASDYENIDFKFWLAGSILSILSDIRHSTVQKLKCVKCICTLGCQINE